VTLSAIVMAYQLDSEWQDGNETGEYKRKGKLFLRVLLTVKC
jgi:hypothetical protein